jgi:hypothetical protein
MSRKVNSNSRKFSKAGKIIFYFLAVIATFAAAFPPLYEVKTKAGINISDRYHAGPFFEKNTRGLFKCEWLYPYKCDRPDGKS